MELFKKLAILFAILAAALSFSVEEADASPACPRCNIVEEGLWTKALVGQTVYQYVRQSNRFYPVQITAVFYEGPHKAVNWYDPKSGRRGKELADQHYSYSSMMETINAGQSAPVSRTERQRDDQKFTGWLASCAMARSDNYMEAFVGYRACCQSSAARQFGPDPICRR